MKVGLHTFHVEQRHIDGGERVNSFSCPISLCAKEDGFIAVNTYRRWMYINCVSYRLPDEVTRFISRFDAGLPVEPFSFTLDIKQAPRLGR